MDTKTYNYISKRKNLFFQFIFLNTLLIFTPVNSQPFLNTLAVLFRARPPWPTVYPTINTGTGNIKQSPRSLNNAPNKGILIAQPLNVNNQNSFKLHNPHFPNPNIHTHQHQPQMFHVRPPQPQHQQNNQNIHSNNQATTPSPPMNENLFEVKKNENEAPQYLQSPSPPPPQSNFRFPDPPSPPRFVELTGSLPKSNDHNSIHQHQESQSHYSKSSAPTLEHSKETKIQQKNSFFPTPSQDTIPQFQEVKKIESNDQNFNSKFENNVKDTEFAAESRFHFNHIRPTFESMRNYHNRDFDWPERTYDHYEKPSGSIHNPTFTSSFQNSKYYAHSKEPSPHKSKSLDFRPSPLLSESGPQYNKYQDNYDWTPESSFSASDAKNPRYESGFKPISYHQYAPSYGTTASHEEYKNSYTQWKTSTTQKPREAKTYYSNKYDKTPDMNEFDPQNKTNPSLETREGSKIVHEHRTPSSSERVEDWLQPKKINKSAFGDFKSQDGKIESILKKSPGKFPVYNRKNSKKEVRVRPAKCEKFHRYGFCPVTQHYPLSQVEAIASRCAALLSHLIAPLPKTEKHFDIEVSKKMENGKKDEVWGKRGWSWKEYKGRPVCDTEEIKVTPGWAKNEDGDWLLILQTEVWKQEAQISVCSFAHDQHSESCSGSNCNKNEDKIQNGRKCVQRFTAQRLAVLDPENEDRCPVIRSVFLPSACICLSNHENEKHSSNSGTIVPIASEEEESSREKRIRPIPILIQNGTFSTTMVVTETINSETSTQQTLTNI